jgi:ornithine cyclodeaminase/alanine dehydrogenase-like protein (mu-crystallin family)
LIGCGPIGRTVTAYLYHVFSGARRTLIYDSATERAADFARELSVADRGPVEVASAPEDVLSACDVMCLATNRVTPHLSDLSICRPGATVLHVSLRDITPRAIAQCDNVVDDVDHVCRAETSLHLAEQQLGTRAFIRTTLGDVLLGRAAPRAAAQGPTVFSPFGLGVLDLAVAAFIEDEATALELGTVVPDFFALLPTERL